MQRAQHPWAVAITLSLLGLSARPAHAQNVAFTYVQISDSQAADAQDQAYFEQVLATIVDAGQPGALLPRAVDVVFFPGDCVNHTNTSEWVTFTQTMDGNLTAAGIPYLIAPGNHDQDNGGIGLYEQYIGNSGVWSQSCAVFTGQNGLTRSTGWTGLRFLGFNNSNGGWNVISPGDLAEIDMRVTLAVAVGENILLVCHHPHNGQTVVPLASILPVPEIVAYVHGHSGSPHVTHGLSGISNPNIWDCNSNAIYQDADLIYCEVFPTQIEAHVIKLVDNPTSLPPASIIQLVHPLVPAGGGGVPPVANFAAQPHSGAAPLAVTFTDQSTGSPTSRAWNFGDGASGSGPNPQHTYNLPGNYSVTLTVTNSAGSDSLTLNNLITVEPPGQTTLLPVADAKVNSSKVTSNYGATTDLRCKYGGTTDATYHSYLKFNVTAPEEVASALLKLFVTDGSVDAGSLFTVVNDWAENTITFANAPVIAGPPLGSAGAAGDNTWIQFDVTSVVTGPGTYSFALMSNSSNSAYYSSREGAAPPQLVLVTLCGNGVADLGETCASCPADVPCIDCNGNGVDDSIDIASGTSQDCNGNGMPDECDLDSGASDDCNVNGIPDECDGGCLPGGATLLMSFTSNTTLPGIGTVAKQDIVSRNTATGTWSMYFDGSDVGAGSLTIDALAVLPGGDLLLSFKDGTVLAGIIVDDSDIVRFHPTSLGASTQGTWSMYFDGSDVELTTNNEDIDGLSVAPDGRLVISTTGDPAVTGVTGLKDEDLLAFNATSLGDVTSGIWSLYFDGSDVALAESGDEDVDGVAIEPGGKILLSTTGFFSTPGVAGGDEDIFAFTPMTLGPTTSGVYSAFFIGTAAGVPSASDVGGVELLP